MKRGEKAPGEGRVRWNVLFTPDEAQFLKEQARREGKSAADVVRAALDQVYRPAETLDPLRALDELAGDYLPSTVVHEALRRQMAGGTD